MKLSNLSQRNEEDDEVRYDAEYAADRRYIQSEGHIFYLSCYPAFTRPRNSYYKLGDERSHIKTGYNTNDGVDHYLDEPIRVENAEVES